MALTGYGSHKRNAALDRIAARKRRPTFPWEKKGLSRHAKMIAFLEFLPITKGIMAGKKMELLDFQREWIEEVYRAGPDGKRRANLAVLSAPRGQGKTGMTAGVSLAHLIGPECEPRGEIYSAATSREQAGILHNEMSAIIECIDDFLALCNVRRREKKIDVIGGPGHGSTYEALSSEAVRAHGLAPSLFIIDEFGQFKGSDLYDYLRTGQGKRDESLGIIISTQAPSDDHPMSVIVDDALEGLDDSIVAHVLCAPESADPFDPDVLRACNPAFGHFLNEGEILKEQEQAKRLKAREPRFRNLRLNQRIDADADKRLVTKSVWKECTSDFDPDDLRGRVCFGGVDLSKKDDLTSICLAFPEWTDDVLDVKVVNWNWTPLESLENRQPREEALFRRWIDEGWIEGIPGPIIRFREVAMKLVELAGRYDIRRVFYDRWRIEDMVVELDEVGGGSRVKEVMEPFGQGFGSMSPAIDYLVELILTGSLHHRGDPVLTAAVMGGVVVMDGAGNMKLDKGKSREMGTQRIDPAVAMVMAVAAAQDGIKKPRRSYLEDEDLIVF